MRLFKKKNKNPAQIMPHYPRRFYPAPLPDIYNAAGDKMDIFFIHDFHMAHVPYGSPVPTKFLWDRFNYGLDTHFYTNGSFFSLVGEPKQRFALFIEPEAIYPGHYDELRKNKQFAIDNFTKIFTHSERILNEFPNAEFMPILATPWHFGGGKDKNKNISVVSSDKTMCDMHKLRLAVACKCRDECLADPFGGFTGVRCGTDEYLDNYRYCIIMENEVLDYYFTERLTSCFATRTVPIYIGAPNIGNWFNTDGMIILNPKTVMNELSKILSGCNAADYESRRAAIEDNFKRVQKYYNTFDMMYDRVKELQKDTVKQELFFDKCMD